MGKKERELPARNLAKTIQEAADNEREQRATGTGQEGGSIKGGT